MIALPRGMLKNLIQWSKREFSHLPWRKKRTLYRTLVSEIMLQQTTVPTVLNHFESFIGRYPNLKSLAETSEEDVLMAWKGLGYYRRAKNLRKACRDLQENHKGHFPKTREELLEISGIGPYTASALMAMGRDQTDLAVDANLERVLARVFRLYSPKGAKLQKEIQEKFWDGKLFTQKDLKGVSFRDLNEALMDLGRVYCRARRAHCEACPLNENCAAFSEGEVASYPVVPAPSQNAKSKEKHQLTLIRVVAKDRRGRVLSYRKKENEWLSGQYEVPTFIWQTTDSTLDQYPMWQGGKIQPARYPTYKTGITKYTIQNVVYECSENEFLELVQNGTFSRLKRLETKELSKLSTGSLKALKSLN